MVLLFSACSFKTPPNEWQYKSVNAYESYKKNFLSSKDALAKSDLQRAMEHAKKSADLTQLAKIELGRCALEISVGIQNECVEYEALQTLIDSKELESYYLFIRNKVEKTDIAHLPDVYRAFAKAQVNQNEKELLEEFEKIEPVVSYLIAAHLIKEKLSVEHIDKILSKASFYGYKKSVLYWLNIKMLKTENEKELQNIKRKIKILES
jgi:hypothetical protein